MECGLGHVRKDKELGRTQGRGTDLKKSLPKTAPSGKEYGGGACR